MSTDITNTFRASLNNSNEIDIIKSKKENHRKSKSIDLATLNKTFANLQVQSNLKSEKRGIDKINEIILENEKFVPHTTKISSKSSSRVSYRKRTPIEVNYNDLLKSLDAIASEVKSNSHSNHSKCEEQLPKTKKMPKSILKKSNSYKKVQKPEIKP